MLEAGLEQLSAALVTSQTPEAVAPRYAEKTPLQKRNVGAAIYDGCLESLGDRRSPGWKIA